MAYPRKWLYETSSKTLVLLALLLFVSCSTAYDDSSSSSEEDFADDLVDDSIVRSAKRSSFSHRTNNLDEDEMAKRALSILAHWRPQILGLPKVNTRSEYVSAVTRGGRPSRPLGQPLRWG